MAVPDERNKAFHPVEATLQEGGTESEMEPILGQYCLCPMGRGGSGVGGVTFDLGLKLLERKRGNRGEGAPE